VLAVGVAAVGLGFLPPPFSGTLIRISGGVVEVRKGAVRPNVRLDVGDVLRSAGISQGFIASGGWHFPEAFLWASDSSWQNVLLNQ